jgi:hypothetical protein
MGSKNYKCIEELLQKRTKTAQLQKAQLQKAQLQKAQLQKVKREIGLGLEKQLSSIVLQWKKSHTEEETNEYIAYIYKLLAAASQKIQQASTQEQIHGIVQQYKDKLRKKDEQFQKQH